MKTSSRRVSSTAYTSIAALWKDVCSGTAAYRKFEQDYHERRFLQALHSERCLEFLAKKLADWTARPVTIGSAFIDARPRFKWTAGAGEIADLLVIVHRTDHKVKPGLACLAQTKVSPAMDALDGGGSTGQQLVLYEKWPEFEFSSSTDIAALVQKNCKTKFSLNPPAPGSNAVLSWPFPFLRICNIATPLSTDSTTPSWTLAKDAAEPEPFAVFGEHPAKAQTTFIEWLKASVSDHKPTAMEVISQADSNTEFASLVKSLLVLLADRQKKQKLGYSGGELLRKAGIDLIFDNLRSFAPKKLQCPDYTSSFEDIGRSNYQGDDSHDGGDGEMLVLYIEVSPEGRSATRPKPAVEKNPYPGFGLI